MTSVATARRLGIPETNWIYLHGCADGHDHWYVSERTDFHSSPAIRRGIRLALDMAGRGLDEMRFIDLYSCFPSAVEIACQEIGLAEDDPRGLTVTGGLPYFGGPGNNYVTHSICHMLRALRARPGAFGLITANGNYVTKHSFGIYSTLPTQRRILSGKRQEMAAKAPHSTALIDARRACMARVSWGCVMTMIRRHEDRHPPAPEVEGEIRELVRRDVAHLRKPHAESGGSEY